MAEDGTGRLGAPDRPDIAATPLSFELGDGLYAWGHTVRVDDPALLEASRSGPGQDLCVLAPAGFRTFNSGAAPTGAFTTTVYRDDVIVHAERMALPGQSGAAFQFFDLPVHRGLNTIRVVVDSNDEVSESDEDNTFVISLDVAFDCDGSSTEAAR
ncbi:MAG: hypothetical protein IRY94_05665 [Rhodospirillaceae bacterium]|nr:hypothetical protein [Rhodospirillaceae bacterium]